jgi:hypothetical protein
MYRRLGVEVYCLMLSKRTIKKKFLKKKIDAVYPEPCRDGIGQAIMRMRHADTPFSFARSHCRSPNNHKNHHVLIHSHDYLVGHYSLRNGQIITDNHKNRPPP